MPEISTSSLRALAQTAKTHAVAGASAGVAFGVIHGAISIYNRQLKDRYDVAAEGLTHVGTGAILGVLGATATAVAGVSIAAIAGRGILAVAVPLVASSAITSSAHEPVERFMRSWSEDVVNGVKGILHRRDSPDAP